MERKKQNHSLNDFHSSENKDSEKELEAMTELQRIETVLKERPMTMKEINIRTGILRENICRRISDLVELQRCQLINKRRCRITGYRNVNEYTTDSTLFIHSVQLSLFD